MPTPIDLEQWINAHASIKKNIKWNYKAWDFYHVGEPGKQPYEKWSAQQKKDLADEYLYIWSLFTGKKALTDILEYPPKNITSDINDDGDSANVSVTPEYAWKMYTKWLAFNLYTEIYGLFPWRLITYKEPELQMLLDSTTMSVKTGTDKYVFGTIDIASTQYIYAQDNLGASLIAPPLYTFDFLQKNKLVGKTSAETVCLLLTWMSNNMTHFNGKLTLKRSEEIWQYRGLPPITKIISGTTDAGGDKTFGHWTAGCHGSAGFIMNILRAVNIPVRIILICGHAVVYFMRDGMYMDHGDNPYSSAFKKSGAGINHLLINEATYLKWFGNNHDNHDAKTPGCDCSKIGYSADYPNHS